MGILNLIEETAGAIAADQALEAVDPNAGFFAKTAAAVAGFEGVAKLKEAVDEREAASEATTDNQ